MRSAVMTRVGGEVKSQYIWSERYVDALVLRDRDTDPETSHMDERIYVQQDANFNTTALVDTAGTVVERVVIGPYGGRSFRAPDWSTTGLNTMFGNYAWVYLFQGGRYDNTTNQYNFRNRDHSVTLGRPIQADPLGYPDGMNRYEWEGSNPIGRLDPSGLSSGDPSKDPHYWWDLAEKASKYLNWARLSGDPFKVWRLEKTLADCVDLVKKTNADQRAAQAAQAAAAAAAAAANSMGPEILAGLGVGGLAVGAYVGLHLLVPPPPPMDNLAPDWVLHSYYDPYPISGWGLN